MFEKQTVFVFLFLFCINCKEDTFFPWKTKDNPGEGKLVLLSRQGYFEAEDPIKRPSYIQDFEEKTGCLVEFRTSSTSEDIFEASKQPELDVVIAPSDVALRLVVNGRVASIDPNKIFNWSKIYEPFQKAKWIRIDDKLYGVPYQWGQNLLLYNKKYFKSPPDSWDILFKEIILEDGKSNKGKVQFYGGANSIADTALYLKHHNPGLGIQDPFALDQSQFDAVISSLKFQKRILKNYWTQPQDQFQDFQKEVVVASNSWNYQLNLLNADRDSIESVIPKEGSTAWADSSMILSTAPHPQCAELWLNHSLEFQHQWEVSRWYGSQSVNLPACRSNQKIDEVYCSKVLGIQWESIYFWRTPVSDCGSGRTCVPYFQWTSAMKSITGLP